MQRPKAPWFKAFLPLLVPSLTACLPSNTGGPGSATSPYPKPSFTISLNPKELATTQGGFATT